MVKLIQHSLQQWTHEKRRIYSKKHRPSVCISFRPLDDYIKKYCIFIIIYTTVVLLFAVYYYQVMYKYKYRTAFYKLIKPEDAESSWGTRTIQYLYLESPSFVANDAATTSSTYDPRWRDTASIIVWMNWNVVFINSWPKNLILFNYYDFTMYICIALHCVTMSHKFYVSTGFLNTVGFF